MSFVCFWVFLLSFTLEQTSESGLRLLDSCHFLTFPPLEKKTPNQKCSCSSIGEKCVTALFVSFPGDLLEISVAFQPLKECAIVVCELSHCKRVLHGALPARPCEELSPGRKKTNNPEPLKSEPSLPAPPPLSFNRTRFCLTQVA